MLLGRETIHENGDAHTLWHLNETAPPFFSDDAAAPVPMLSLLNGATAGIHRYRDWDVPFQLEENIGGIPGSSLRCDPSYYNN
jgi:hypothetical protein